MKIHNRTLIFLSALLSAMIGASLIWLGTLQGPGVGGDATIYITSARNLLAGKGLGLVNPAGEFRLIPYFPPFYPLVLAFFGLFGLDPASFARFLNILLFALTIFAVSVYFSRISKNWLAGLLSGLMIAGSPILTSAYSWAMSETLCMFLMAIGLIALERYMTTNRSKWLVLSALGCGLSFLTRYSSAACVAAACLVLLFFQRKKFTQRFKDTFFYGLIAILPVLIWLIYDIRMTDTVASRSMLEGINMQSGIVRLAGQCQTIFTQWFFPESWIDSGRIPSIFLLILYWLITLFPLLIILWISLHDSKEAEQDLSALNRLALIYAIFFYCYLLVVALVSLTTYPPITIGSRMMIPAHISFLILLCWTAVRLIRHFHSSAWLKSLLMIAFFGLAAFYGLRSLRSARQNAIDGMGYNSVRWKTSETISYLKENVPEDYLLVTNEETALLFLLDRTSWPMHEVYVDEPDRFFYAYEEGEPTLTDYGRIAFQQGDALLVVFDTFEDQMRDVYAEATESRIDALFQNLSIVIDTDDGVIYSLDAR